MFLATFEREEDAGRRAEVKMVVLNSPNTGLQPFTRVVQQPPLAWLIDFTETLEKNTSFPRTIRRVSSKGVCSHRSALRLRKRDLLSTSLGEIPGFILHED